MKKLLALSLTTLTLLLSGCFHEPTSEQPQEQEQTQPPEPEPEPSKPLTDEDQ